MKLIKKKRYGYGGGLDSSDTLGMIGSGLTTASAFGGPAAPYLAGAGVLASGISSVISAKKAKEEEKKIEEENRKQELAMDSRTNALTLSNYPTKGILGSEMYKYGGMLKKKYAEGGLLPISLDANLAVGDKHGQDTDMDGQEGIPVGQNEEVEDGEVVTDDGKVFSHRLGYAKKASKIIASPEYRKFELNKNKNKEILDNKVSTEVDKNTANRNISKLVNPLDNLFMEQEMVATKMGLRKETNKMAYGGMLDEEDPYIKKLLPSLYGNLDTRTTEQKVAYNPTIENPNINEIQTSLEGNNNPMYSNTSYNPIKPAGYFGSGNQNLSSTGLPNTTNTSSSGSNVTNGILQSGRFIDNVANAYLTTQVPNIPKPRLLQTRGLNTNYDISAAKNKIDTDYSNFNIGQDRSSTDLGSANANKGMALRNKFEATGKLYQNKENIENQLKNRDIEFRTGVEGQNNSLINKFNYDKMYRKQDKNRMISANFANASSDLQNIYVEGQQSDNDKMAIEMYSKALNSNGVVDRNLKQQLIKMLGSEKRYNELFNK